MLLNSKKMAYLGLLLAFAVVLIILSGVFEFNTLFLLGAASFCVGIAVRDYGIKLGAGFYIASIILGVILAPNKLYCITYAGMGLYLVVREIGWEWLARSKNIRKRSLVLWGIKFATFNLIYIPILIFLPKLIYQGSISSSIMLLLAFGGQLILFIYDKAYDYFQNVIWGKFRSRMK